MNPIFERIDLRRTFQNAQICNGEFEFLQKEKKDSILPIIVKKKKKFYSDKIKDKEGILLKHFKEKKGHVPAEKGLSY